MILNLHLIYLNYLSIYIIQLRFLCCWFVLGNFTRISFVVCCFTFCCRHVLLINKMQLTLTGCYIWQLSLHDFGVVFIFVDIFFNLLFLLCFLDFAFRLNDIKSATCDAKKRETSNNLFYFNFLLYFWMAHAFNGKRWRSSDDAHSALS